MTPSLGAEPTLAKLAWEKPRVIDWGNLEGLRDAWQVSPGAFWEALAKRLQSFFFFFFTGVSLLYNFVLVYAVQ